MLGKLVEEVEERVKEERGEKELLMLELGSMFVNTIFGHPVAVPIQIRQLCTVLKVFFLKFFIFILFYFILFYFILFYFIYLRIFYYQG